MYKAIFILLVLFFGCSNPITTETKTVTKDNSSQPPQTGLTYTDDNQIIQCDSMSYDSQNDIMNFHIGTCGLSIPFYIEYSKTHNYHIK